MLRHRLITGPLLIAMILAIVWLDSALERWPLVGAWRSLADLLGWHGDHAPAGSVLVLLALGLVPLIALETTHMVERVGVASSRRLSVSTSLAAFAAVLVAASLASASHAAAVVASALVGILVAGLLRFSRGHNVDGVLAATGALLLVSVYAGALIAFWMLLRREHSAWVLVGAVLTTKSCDIGAYFTGISIGRRKLIPWLSPGKTWEGLAGGVVSAVLVGAALAGLSSTLPEPRDHIPWMLGALGGLIIALVGQFGDLAESLLKRDARLKDSGGLVPGMGGVLDVLDSPLMTGPAVYWLLAT